MADPTLQDLKDLNAKLVEKNKEAQTLYNFCKFFTHAESMDEVISLCLNCYGELGMGREAAFLSYQEGKLVFSSGVPSGFFPPDLQKPLVSLEHMSEAGISAWLQQINHDPVFKKTVALYFHTENFFASPLFIEERPFGVLLALGKTDVSYDNRVASMLNQVVPFANLALSNLKMRSRLRHESMRDELSGLFNAQYLPLRLGHEIARADRYGYPVCCVMLDVDHYKSLRDEKGFPFVEGVMKKISTLLERHTRKSDVMIRSGVDEYVWLLPHCSKEKAKWACENLIKSLEKFPIYRAPGDKQGERVTLSMGIAEFPSDAKAQKPLMTFAHQALVTAKKRGRNQFALFDESMLHAMTLLHETKVLE